MPTWRLSAFAKADIINLLARTEESFGDTARHRYEILIFCGFRDIAANPENVGSIPNPELGSGVCTYHLRHSRDHARTSKGFVRRPRHLVLYRSIQSDLIGIGRVLHDSMEVERHLPPSGHHRTGRYYRQCPAQAATPGTGLEGGTVTRTYIQTEEALKAWRKDPQFVAAYDVHFTAKGPL